LRKKFKGFLVNFRYVEGKQMAKRIMEIHNKLIWVAIIEKYLIDFSKKKLKMNKL
jgi:hypothetical protein